MIVPKENSKILSIIDKENKNVQIYKISNNIFIAIEIGLRTKTFQYYNEEELSFYLKDAIEQENFLTFAEKDPS